MTFFDANAKNKNILQVGVCHMISFMLRWHVNPSCELNSFNEYTSIIGIC